MPENQIPIEATTKHESIRFGEIDRIFRKSEYGQKLATKLRYDRYRPADEVDDKEWEFLLGADVNNLQHLRLTYGQARLFIDYQNSQPDNQFSAEDQESLLLAAMIHDWGEAIVGDKSYELKTEADESTEITAIRKIVQDLFGAEEHKEMCEKMLGVIDSVIVDKTTKLHEAFDTLERVGYLRTGVRAWNASKETSDKLLNGLQWLTSNVIPGHIPTMIERAEKYPAVKAQLVENSDTITEAFRELPEMVFDNYKDRENPEEIAARIMRFKLARAQWEEYKNKLQTK